MFTSITPLDFTILQAIQEALACPALNTFFKLIKKIDAEHAIVVVILLILWKATRRYGLRAAVAVLFAHVCGSMILKNWVARPRPFIQYPTIHLIAKGPKSFSFPSGHTSISFAIAFALFFSDCAKKWKILALAVAALIGFSRLYLQMHFPSDVFGGICLGCVGGFVANKLVSYWEQRQNKK